MDDDFELDTPPPNPTIESPSLEVTMGSTPLKTAADEDKLFYHTSKISVSQEATRAKIALTFTQIFLLIVIIALVLPTVIKIGFPDIIPDATETTKSLITLIASVLAGPFGFIVGFYFKQEREG